MKPYQMPASSSWSPKLTGSTARWTWPRLDVSPRVCCYIPTLSPLTLPLSHPHPCLSPGHHALWTKLHSFPLDFFSLPATFPSPSQGRLQCGTEGEIPKVLSMGRLKEDFKRVCSGWPVSQRRLYTDCKGELSLQTDISAHFIISFPLFIQPDNKYIMRILLCSNKTKEKTKQQVFRS